MSENGANNALLPANSERRANDGTRHDHDFFRRLNITSALTLMSVHVIPSSDFQGSDTEQGEDDGEDPEADGDAVFVGIDRLSFFDRQILKMVVQR